MSTGIGLIIVCTCSNFLEWVGTEFRNAYRTARSFTGRYQYNNEDYNNILPCHRHFFAVSTKYHATKAIKNYAYLTIFIVMWSCYYWGSRYLSTYT